MPTLILERQFDAAPERVFEYVSKTEHLLRWWGPETINVDPADHQLMLDRLGPWMSVMVNTAGQRFKVSGHVTHFDPPNSIGFTWAWHDDTDTRGVESHVTMRLVPAQNGGTAFTLTHADLPSDEAAQNHSEGWASSLKKLERFAGRVLEEEG